MLKITYTDHKPETFEGPSEVSTDSTLFSKVEQLFNTWYDHNTQEGAPGEYKEKYEGEEAIYTKIGAIEQAIEQIFDVAHEQDETVITWQHAYRTYDLECSFEG